MAASQKETARFVAELCTELRDLARGASLEPLAYLLEMTVLEATRVARPQQRIRPAA
jgi:hypothetical protein